MGIDIEVAKGLADVLIAEGLKFDTVVSHTATFDLMQQKQINSLERRCAQAEHRAARAERALKISSLKIATMIDEEVPACDVCENYQSCNLTVGACSEYMEKCCVEQAENVALRERLSKAVELPVKIGDRVFCIVGLDPAVEEFEVIKIEIQKSNLSYTVFEFQGIDVGYKTAGFLSGYGKRWFTELEAAEARLKELQRGEQ